MKVHEANRGYGGNQKTCYDLALAAGADIIVMIHPDYQYSPLLVMALASMVAYDEYDIALWCRHFGRPQVCARRRCPVIREL